MLCHGFDKDTFLESCQKDNFFYKTFYIDELTDCLVCYNVSIEAEAFKDKNLKITDEECLVFYGGDIGTVNSDFFKQFPNSNRMTFQNVKVNLKSTGSVEEHNNMELVGFLSSEVKGNHETNALHSLTNLNKFVMTDCLLEDTTIDKMFLEKSINLVDVTFSDGRENLPEDGSLSILANLDGDIFKNIPNLEFVYISIDKWTVLPPNLLQGKTSLNSAIIDGRFTEFPANLPDSIEDLSIAFHEINSISKANFENLKNLKYLSISYGSLELIDGNTFEDLKDLEFLALNDNNIKEFSSDFVKNSKNLKIVILANNPVADSVDLSELGLNDDKKKGYYISPDYQDNYDYEDE